MVGTRARAPPRRLSSSLSGPPPPPDGALLGAGAYDIGLFFRGEERKEKKGKREKEEVRVAVVFLL